MTKYIYEYKNWTDFSWQEKAVNTIFGEVRLMHFYFGDTGPGITEDAGPGITGVIRPLSIAMIVI